MNDKSPYRASGQFPHSEHILILPQPMKIAHQLSQCGQLIIHHTLPTQHALHNFDA